MRFLKTRTDSQLDRLLSYPFVLRVLLDGLRRKLKPELAPKFNGDIQYQIAANGSQQQWILSIRDGHASLRSGVSADPKLVVRAPAAIFVRLLTGQMNAGAATLEGKLHLEGDLSALSQLGKMAGN
jgi:putative sterol carrier protein